MLYYANQTDALGPAAAGDDSTDDTSALNTKLSNMKNGDILDGNGLTYKVTNTLTLVSGITLRNFVFDYTTGASSSTLLSASGSIGSSISITSTVELGQAYLDISSTTGINAGDILWIRTSENWCDGSGGSDVVTKGEFVRVRTNVSSTLINLIGQVCDSYASSGSPYVVQLAPIVNIRLERILATGSGPGNVQKAVSFKYCQNIVITECEFDLFDDSCINFVSSYGLSINNCRLRRCDRDGYAYGVVLDNGSQYVTVTGCYGEDLRHLVTCGGTHGVIRHVVASNNMIMGAKDAMMDCHEGAQFINYSNNIGTYYDDGTATGDGMCVQGSDMIVAGNTIIGALRYGILYQSFPSGSYGTNHAIISGNNILGPGQIGIYLNAVAGMDMAGVAVTGNVVYSPGTQDNDGYGIDVEAGGANIRYFAIGNNSVSGVKSSYYSVVMKSDAPYVVTDFTFNGNVISQSNDAVENIHLGATVMGDIAIGVISGNTLENGLYAIYGLNADKMTVVGNTFYSQTNSVDIGGTTKTVANNTIA